MDKMIIVIVGDKEYIEDGLKDLGWGKLKTVDPDKIRVKKVQSDPNRTVETQSEIR